MISNSIKIVVKILLSVALIAIVFYFWYTKSVGEVDVRTTTHNYEIAFEELNSKVYVQVKSWGVAGNHEEILLSSIPLLSNAEFSKEDCYVFYASEIYYKKAGADTLIVYTGASEIASVPNKFSSPIKIRQIELKNYDEVREYSRNYKKYGLSKISIYEND